MKSMTGFGSAKVSDFGVVVEFNIRSVNGRFLEPRWHLPKDYVLIEADLRKILSSHLTRGTVDIYCQRKIDNVPSSSHVEVNSALAKKLHSEINRLSKSLKLNNSIQIQHLVALAPILNIKQENEVTTKETTMVLGAFKNAILGLVKERVREGLALQKVFLKLIHSLEVEIKKISDQAKNNKELVESRLNEKIKTKNLDTVLDQQRWQQEIFYWTDKADIAEEIQRLNEHIRNYKNLLLSKNSEGKKIDFYTQELLREINTIGSKSQNAEITARVVEAKGIIEKLKEQAQNIE